MALRPPLFVLIGFFALGAFSGSALAASPQSALEAAAASEERTEESEELAEDAEEQTEQAAATPFAMSDAKPAHADRINAITRSIRYHKKFIVLLRRSIAFTLTLPHDTVRWQDHLPKKRERLKAFRHRVRELRALRHELRTA